MEILQCKKLSEVDKKFSGFIAGFVLGSEERATIVKKSGNYYKGIKSLEILTLITKNVCTEGKIAKFSEQILFKKYKKELEIYITIPIAELSAIWDNNIDSSLMRGIFIASILRNDTFPELLEKICNRINLFISSELKAKAESLIIIANLENHIKISDEKNLIIKNKYREIKKEKELLASENEKLKKEIRFIDSTLNKEKEVIIIKSAESSALDEIEFLKKKIEILQNKLFEKDELIKSFNESRNIVESFILPKMEECENCEKRNLCARRVLMIGGLNKFEVNYKKTVESLNGEFKYHDGKKTGNMDLKESIKWADTVLFSTDINSHYACLEAKKLCKKMKKDYFVMKNSGIASFNRTINEICSC